MTCPPTKRLRGLDHDEAMQMAFNDPFGDDEAFTQDDLDEIDIISSQAITSTPASGLDCKPGAKPAELTGGSSWSVSRAATNHSTFGSSSSSSSRGIPSREPLSDRQQQQQVLSDRDDAYSLLEAQHAELKRKLKEVEEEIVLKSGEIRVLRDSLKGAQQEKEAQRQNQILLDSQRQREQSERAKELNKKVQSLQSELQFKEAEINEMKSKLHSSDRNKMGSPLPQNSPKVLSSLAQLHHGSGSSSSSPTGNGFITKETFSAHLPFKTTPVTSLREGVDKGSSSSRSGDKQETSRPDPFLTHRPVHLQHRGGVLLGLLLQQPLSPSSLGLSQLLYMSLTEIPQMSGGLSAGFLLHSDAAVSGCEFGAALTPVQSLAVTGLNMLSQRRPEAAASNRNKRSCPGAVLLLPLLDLHLSRLSHTLDSLSSTSSGGSNSSTASSILAVHAVPTGGPLRLEGLTGFSMDDVGLAALRLLYLLVAHSDEVVEAVLKESQSRGTDNKAEHSSVDKGLCSQNALLQSLLRLCEGMQGSSSSSQREKLVLNAMKTLCVLIERTPPAHSERLQRVLPAVCVCLSADSRLQVVSQCVSVLVSLCDHPTLAQQLSCQHDPCVFLKLFQLTRSRPDTQATHRDWIQLDLQVVRLLSRLLMQKSESCTTGQLSSCPCYTELVQTVVIVFHRQWLDLRGFHESADSTGLVPPLQQCPAPSPPWCRGIAASLLRECLMLLHWLLLHHGSFSESCRPLLHMYDQVIPAVRDTLRRIPELSESEELALEEICRSDGDEADDMEVDATS